MECTIRTERERFKASFHSHNEDPAEWLLTLFGDPALNPTVIQFAGLRDIMSFIIQLSRIVAQASPLLDAGPAFSPPADPTLLACRACGGSGLIPAYTGPDAEQMCPDCVGSGWEEVD